MAVNEIPSRVYALCGAMGFHLRCKRITDNFLMEKSEVFTGLSPATLKSLRSNLDSSPFTTRQTDESASELPVASICGLLTCCLSCPRRPATRESAKPHPPITAGLESHATNGTRALAQTYLHWDNGKQPSNR